MKPMTEVEQLEADTAIATYMKTYRTHFPKRCLPKHHFLEAHCSPWLSSWNHGMTHLGETALELAHQTMAMSERSARHLGNSERGALTAVKTHFLTSEPRLLANVPAKRQYNKKTVSKSLF